MCLRLSGPIRPWHNVEPKATEMLIGPYDGIVASSVAKQVHLL